MKPSAKLCPQCNQTKSADAFYRSRHTKTGLTSHCIDCLRSARRRRLGRSESSRSSRRNDKSLTAR